MYYKNRFFPDFRRTRGRIRMFLSLKPSRDQDEDNDMRYSPIGSAVFDLLSDTQTHRQTDIHRVALVYRIYLPQGWCLIRNIS